MTSPSLPNLRTFDEIAEMLGVPVRSLLDQAYGPNPKITHIHVGNVRYMTDEQFVEFLTRRTKRATPAAGKAKKNRGGRPRGRKTRTAIPAALAA